MSRTVRVIVLNTDETVAADLRSELLGIDGVKIVAEIEEPALLMQAVDTFPAEVLLVHLDPNPAGLMDVVAPLIEARKEQIAAIAMTEDRDAELVMRAMRAGMREFLWKPVAPEQLAEILHRLGTQAATESGRRVGRLISVVGAGGGQGATQLATNLAVELAQLEGADDRSGKPRVAVVDMDFRFGQVAIQLDAQPSYTIAELCDTPERIDPQMIDRAMVKHPTGVHVLARPNELAQAERLSAGQCAASLAMLQEHYDFVIVDIPARFDPSARAVLDTSDVQLITLQLQVPPVRTADRLLHELATTGYNMNRIKLVCNRHGRDAGYLEQADVEATLKRSFDFLVPEDWRTSAGAINIGAPLLTHAPKSKLRLAYKKIAEMLVGYESQADGDAASSDGTAAKKKNVFSFLVGSGR